MVENRSLERPDVSDAAESLLWFLKSCDFAIGPADHLRMQRLLASLAAESALPETDADLDAWIRPLVCRSDRDQERFDPVFADWLRSRPDTKPQPPTPAEQLRTTVDAIERPGAFWQQLLGLAILALVGYFAWRRFHATPRPEQPTRPAPSPANPLPIGGTEIAFLAAMLALVLAALVVWYVRVRRARAFLVQRTAREPAESAGIAIAATPAIYDARLLTLAAQGLGAYRRLPSEKLDIERSVNATAREAGRFIPVFVERAAVPEYLILIDRGSPADLFAQYASGLASQLEQNNLSVEWFYFDSIPRQCYSRRGFHPISTQQLAERYPEHRVIVFSDGASFHPPGNSFVPWMKIFEAWERKTLVTPIAREYWGRTEAAIGEAGWTVIPAQQDEIAATARQSDPPPADPGFVPGLIGSLDPRTTALLHGPPPPAEEIEELVSELRISLGAAGFEWLCSCAAYPGVDWNVTMYLGMNRGDAEGKPLLSEPAFLALARLPWFRYGAMPEWFRMALMRRLAPAALDETRALLQTLLLTGADGSPAAALDVSLARREALNWLTQRFIHKREKTAQPEEPLRDRTFVEFLSGRNPAALSLPERIAGLFRRRVVRQEWLRLPNSAWSLIVLQFAAELGLQKLHANGRTAPGNPALGLGFLLCGLLMLRRFAPALLAGAAAAMLAIAVAINGFTGDAFTYNAGLLNVGLLWPATLFLLVETTPADRILTAIVLWFAAGDASSLVSAPVSPLIGAALLGVALMLFGPRFLRRVKQPDQAGRMPLPTPNAFSIGPVAAIALVLISPIAATATFVAGCIALAYFAVRRVPTPVTIYATSLLFWMAWCPDLMRFSHANPVFVAIGSLIMALLLATWWWRPGRDSRPALPAMTGPTLILAAACLAAYFLVPISDWAAFAVILSAPLFSTISIRCITFKPELHWKPAPAWLRSGPEIAGPALALWFATRQVSFLAMDTPIVHALSMAATMLVCAGVSLTAAVSLPRLYRFELGRRNPVPKPPPLDQPLTTRKDRLAGAFCYFLFGIPALFVRSRFVRFHAVQALSVWCACFVEYFAVFVLAASGMAGLAMAAAGMLELLELAFIALLGIQAMRGRMTRVPVIGKLAFRWTEPKPPPAAPPPPVPQPEPVGKVYISALTMREMSRDLLIATLAKAGFVIASGPDAADLVIVIYDQIDYYAEDRLWLQRSQIETASKLGIPVLTFITSDGPIPADLAAQHLVQTFVTLDELAERAVAAALNVIQQRRRGQSAPL